jgi:hypothetical protein
MAPVNLSVTSTSDVTAPTLTAFDFNTKTPDVSAGPVDVNCSMILTDALAGVSRASCFLENPVDGSGYACITFAPASGDRNNGTFSCDVTVPQYALDGSWTANVLAWDGVGNLAAFDAPTLRGLGFPTDLTVTSDPVDSTPPVVTNFDFNPKSVDTTSAAAVVACTVDVSDDLSGVDHVVCGFNSPSFIQSQSCLAQIPTAGTPSNGTYSCSVVIPQSSEGGIWQAELEIHDRVGNLLQTDSLTLATAGFPTELDVACDGGSSPSFSIRFPSKTSMVWDPVTDAFLYNIYRGDFSGLIDAILDGSPDGGYGSCQNANDPNPTDTTYLGAENPLPGEGFHYLVSYMLISGEAGLGTRSDGASRVAQTPCGLNAGDLPLAGCDLLEEDPLGSAVRTDAVDRPEGPEVSPVLDACEHAQHRPEVLQRNRIDIGTDPFQRRGCKARAGGGAVAAFDCRDEGSPGRFRRSEARTRRP